VRRLLFTRLLFVVYFLEVGLLLVFLPWFSFWERNYFADAMPLLGTIVHNYFVRGAISGLGLVNVGAAISELLTIFAVRRR
jgi:hypothetical protein